MVMSWFVNAVLGLVFAFLAAQAAYKERPSVQTVLIRICTSWAITVQSLAAFDLSRVPLFSFSVEAQEMEGGDSATIATMFQFPEELQALYERIWNFFDVLTPDIASDQETWECWADYTWPSVEGIHGPKLMAPAFYWTMILMPARLLTAYLVCFIVSKMKKSAAAIENIAKSEAIAAFALTDQTDEHAALKLLMTVGGVGLMTKVQEKLEPILEEYQPPEQICKFI